MAGRKKKNRRDGEEPLNKGQSVDAIADRVVEKSKRGRRQI